jgi:ATP-binding cassette, subfamily C (CFTR/MRP), member 1
MRTSMFYWWALSAASTLFRKQLHRVLNTPMAFLLFKPVGELLAAFTSDQDKVDEALPDAVHLAGARVLLVIVNRALIQHLVLAQVCSRAHVQV